MKITCNFVSTNQSMKELSVCLQKQLVLYNSRAILVAHDELRKYLTDFCDFFYLTVCYAGVPKIRYLISLFKPWFGYVDITNIKN